jgi:hypothetical protein
MVYTGVSCPRTQHWKRILERASTWGSSAAAL